MADPSFRFVCEPQALTGSPVGWAQEMLRDGEVALVGGGGLEAINAIAHDLGQPAILVIRQEDSASLQDQAVISYAGSLPVVWVASQFSDQAAAWARDRGPMTLLVEAGGPLEPGERRRIDRFVAILGRQSE